MMRRATYPKRRSKRCAREGTPRAVSFRECGDRGWRVGFSTDRFRRRGLVLQKNVILTKTPYVACIGNDVEKDGQMTQTPEDFGAHFDVTAEIGILFLLFHPLDSSSSPPHGRGRTHPRAGARERHTSGVHVEPTRLVEVGATRSKRSKAKAKGEGGHAGCSSDPGERK